MRLATTAAAGNTASPDPTTTYHYRVRSQDHYDRYSAYSNTVTVTTPAEPPQAPWPGARAAGANSILVEWELGGDRSTPVDDVQLETKTTGSYSRIGGNLSGTWTSTSTPD